MKINRDEFQIQGNLFLSKNNGYPSCFHGMELVELLDHTSDILIEEIKLGDELLIRRIKEKISLLSLYSGFEIYLKKRVTDKRKSLFLPGNHIVSLSFVSFGNY
jgi:hypothetical protein